MNASLTGSAGFSGEASSANAHVVLKIAETLVGVHARGVGTRV